MTRGALFIVAAGMIATAPVAAAAPTDPEIAHIAYTAGVLDIAAGNQARSCS